MKVLVFMTQFYQLSGAERLAVELAEDLNRRGIHADILSMYTEELPGVAEAKKKLLEKGIPAVHFLGMRIHPPLRSLLPAIARLKRLVREEGYTVVETSTLSPTVIASWAVRGRVARHVAGLHQVFRKDRESSAQYKFWRLTVRCSRQTRYYAISEYVAGHWNTYSGTPAEKIRRIYNGIPDDCFLTPPDREGVHREMAIPAGGRIALYVGRLAAYKGIDTLVEALAPLLESENLFLLCVGLADPYVPGTVEMLERIEKMLPEVSWGERVKFLGYRGDVPRLMASSDLLVHPTRIEGFGLVLAEAMASGLPVVSSDVEAIPEILYGTDSIMVPPDDPAALRRGVLQALCRSERERGQAIEKGRRRSDDFRTQRRVEEMVTLFSDVLSGRF